MLLLANTLVCNADLSMKHHIQSIWTAKTTVWCLSLFILIPKFQSLEEVDVNILAVWKTMKHSSVKASIFGEGFKDMKLLKAAATWRSFRFTWSFTWCLMVNLSFLLFPDSSHLPRDQRDQMLDPDNMFSLTSTDFRSSSRPTRLCNNNLMSDKESSTQRINEFKTNIKVVFMKELLDELDKALRIDDETFLYFEVFNAQMELREEERSEKIQTLVSLYGNRTTSKFQQKGYIGVIIGIIWVSRHS